MPTLEDFVEAVRRDIASLGLSLQPGASEDDIASLAEAVRETFGADLPPRHLDLLRMVNGMNENSLVIYATRESRDVNSEYIIPGFVEENINLRGDNEEEFADLLIFSSSDQHVHAHDLVSGKFLLQPKTTEPPDEVFDTFDELMIHALRRIIRPEFLP